MLVGDTALTSVFAECQQTCLASAGSRSELWMDQMKVSVLSCCSPCNRVWGETQEDAVVSPEGVV